ncbi:MAG: DegT/DnrJ/EryC1/StrS family aminotransferase [Candidatus Pacebacteria bacterium]|nr:DegT/DnrJ/EryC1/StrS family aminotransferase [Candidatus Paceibacterota bacterium]
MILVNQVKIPKNAKKYLNDCVESTWISGQGRYVEKFEKEFAKFIGKKYAVSTNSGTSALHLALLALDIKAGDEVILPALTIGSCYFAIWQTGAKAIPIDVLPDTYNINPSLIEKNINNKTKAIMPVHLYGEACEMDSILKIAKKYRLKVVEDAAEAHGAIYKNKKLGSFGDLACFSFYANKLITTGEGGAVLTNNKKMYEKMQRLKNLNFSQQKRFVHQGIGYKYELSNLEAALGLASLEEVEQNLSLKAQMANYYDDQLKDIPGIITPVKRAYTKSSYWMYAILVKKEQFGVSKKELMKILLNKYDIQTREFFYPPQIAFKKMNLYINDNFPVAEKLSAEGLYLPSGLGNTKEDFQKVVAAIKQIHADAKRKIY